MNRRDAIKTALAALSTPVLPVVASKRTPRALENLRTHGGARLINGKWRLNPIVKWDYDWVEQRWVVIIFDGCCCISNCLFKTVCNGLTESCQISAGKLEQRLKARWNQHCPENPISL